MKKRTHQCVEWMGYLAGLRDFIETAGIRPNEGIGERSSRHVLSYSALFHGIWVV